MNSKPDSRALFAALFFCVLAGQAFGATIDFQNPTNDSNLTSLWQNISVGWALFQGFMALVGAFFVYRGCMKISKHSWPEVFGFIGAGLAIAIAPMIYQYLQTRNV